MGDVIAALPGDGIGPEVLEQAVRVLERLASHEIGQATGAAT